MPQEIIMPALGMAQETGKLIAWLKQEGDEIKKGEPIFEVETDKVTIEIEAPASGKLASVSANAGEDVPVGQVIALLLAPGEQAPAQSKAAQPAAAPEPFKAADGAPATPLAQVIGDWHKIDLSQVQPGPGGTITGDDIVRSLGKTPAAPADRVPYVPSAGRGGRNGGAGGKVLASPKAKRLAAEQGIDLSLIAGSGPEGAVLAADVLSYRPAAPAPAAAMPITAPRPAAPPAAPGPNQTPLEMSSAWRIMAQRLSEAWQTIPHFILKREVDVTALIEWRERVKNRFETKVTYTDLLVKICAAALQKHPRANASWHDGIYLNHEINVGLAVAVEDGLLVPVIQGADGLGLAGIAKRRAELVERAQANRLKLEDMQNGTFTISNLGMYNVDNFNAIVNPPQAAILAVGGITERYIVVNKEAVIRPVMTLSLSCDHRVLDGARAAEFLGTIADIIADPLSIFD